MMTYNETRELPFSPEALFSIVSDVESYPRFIKGCQKVTVVTRGDNILQARVTAGFGAFRETYTCNVHLTPYSEIRVTYVEGPFSHLDNVWTFAPTANGTTIDFTVSFQFHSAFYQFMMEGVFKKIVHDTIRSFEEEANHRLHEKVHLY